MSTPKASRTRAQIRQAIGYNVGRVIVGEVTATGDTASLIDTYGLAVGGTNDYKGSQVIILTATQAITGQKSFVTSFTGGDCTIAPVLTAAITDGDTYELWLPGYKIEQVNDKINEAIIGASDDILVDKETHTTFKKDDKYEYDCLSSFVALNKVEYVYHTEIDTLLEDCSSVWTEQTGANVTATLDTTLWSSGGLKLVVADAASAEILSSEVISSTNITDCDELLITVYSTAALTAGYVQVLLDNTALCASPVETLNIPATSAYTETTHVISLANPTSDSAIISVGIKMATDVGAFTLYVKDIKAQHSKSRIYKELSPNLWDIVHASTPLLKINEDAYSQIANDRILRLTGYAVPAVLSADSTASEIDPDYIIARATALCLLSGAGTFDIDERFRRAQMWMGISETRLRQGRTTYPPSARFV